MVTWGSPGSPMTYIRLVDISGETDWYYCSHFPNDNWTYGESDWSWNFHVFCSSDSVINSRNSHPISNMERFCLFKLVLMFTHTPYHLLQVKMLSLDSAGISSKSRCWWVSKPRNPRHDAVRGTRSALLQGEARHFLWQNVIYATSFHHWVIRVILAWKLSWSPKWNPSVGHWMWPFLHTIWNIAQVQQCDSFMLRRMPVRVEGVAVAYKLVRYSAIPLSFRVPHGTTDPSDRIAANARLVAKTFCTCLSWPWTSELSPP